MTIPFISLWLESQHRGQSFVALAIASVTRCNRIGYSQSTLASTVASDLLARWALTFLQQPRGRGQKSQASDGGEALRKFCAGSKVNVSKASLPNTGSHLTMDQPKANRGPNASHTTLSIEVLHRRKIIWRLTLILGMAFQLCGSN